MRRKVILTAIVAIILAIVAAETVASQEFGSKSLSSSSTSEILTSSSSSTGTLAVLMTSSSLIPQGVAAVYITYNELQIHVNCTDNQSGWIVLGTNGEINLPSVVNSTQTGAAANISVRAFDALRLNITSVTVTFQGQNNTANLVTNQDYLSVLIQGGLQIRGGQTSGVLLEMTPTVLLLGNITNPIFGLLPAAKGYILPSLGICAHPHQDNRDDYSGSLKSPIRELTRFQMSASNLVQDFLNVTVQNTGQQ